MYSVLNTENTYAWMIATAVSNIINTIWMIIIRGRMMFLTEIVLLPNSLISKCPAIMFAVSRTASLPGRIKLLTVSIITINGISAAGVPEGTKWLNILLVLLVHPYSMVLNHRGRASVIENARWLDLVKI